MQSDKYARCTILLIALIVGLLLSSLGLAQERRSKLRITNAGFTITALPLLAAQEWRIFNANNLDMEVILMQSALVPAALTQGDIDYQAGVGPASVNATMSGFATRAIWFSTERISYWLMAKPQFKTVESLKGKKVAVTGLGGTVHVAFNMALEKVGANPKDFVLVSIAGQQIQQLISLESGYVDAAVLSPPVTLGAQKKGFNKVLDVGAMVEMPGGGLTTLAKTIQERPVDTKRVIRSLQMAKEEIRKSKAKKLGLDRQAFAHGPGSRQRHLRSISHHAQPDRRADSRRHGHSGEVGPIPRPTPRQESSVHRHRRRPPRHGSRPRNGLQDSLIRSKRNLSLAHEVGEG